MKVAFITSGFLPVPAVKGGAVEDLINIIIDENEKYNKMDIEVFSIFDKDANIESLQYNNSKFNFIKTNKISSFLDFCLYIIASKLLKKRNSHSYKFVFQRLEYIKKVSNMLKKNDYDKIILENHPTLYLALKWNKNYIKYNNKYYYHCHNDINKLYGCEKLFYNTRKFIAISNYILNKVLNTYKKFNYKNIVILKNCIRIENFKNEVNIDKVKETYKINPKKKIILYVGRLVEEKGILDIIKALKFLKTEDYQLVIAGGTISKINVETAFTKKLKQECRKYEDKIIFTGYIDHNKIYEIYKIADVVLLPSIWDEPAGLTMLETIASNVPLITTNVGGIKEYIKDDLAIILEKDENLIQNIAKNIDLIFENQEIKNRLSKNGFNYAKTYNQDRYYKEFFKIIKEEGDN